MIFLPFCFCGIHSQLLWHDEYFDGVYWIFGDISSIPWPASICHLTWFFTRKFFCLDQHQNVMWRGYLQVRVLAWPASKCHVAWLFTSTCSGLTSIKMSKCHLTWLLTRKFSWGLSVEHIKRFVPFFCPSKKCESTIFLWHLQLHLVHFVILLFWYSPGVVSERTHFP